MRLSSWPLFFKIATALNILMPLFVFFFFLPSSPPYTLYILLIPIIYQFFLLNVLLHEDMDAVYSLMYP